MARIVTTMKHLDDSSEKIAEIIRVIKEIALQTSILALNAAVEADRAGDQGQVFSLVAAEVRSPAGRSTQAANEIKTLIGISTSQMEVSVQKIRVAGANVTKIVSGIRERAATTASASCACID